MSASKKEESEKKESPLFWKEVPKRGTSMFTTETEWKRRKWPYWLGAGVIAAAIGVNFGIGNPAGKLINGIYQKGKPAVVEKVKVSEYQGQADVATQNYFSIGGNDLGYIVNDYNASQLKDEGLIKIIGNPTKENKDLIRVDKIIKEGVKKPLYERLAGTSTDYSDAIIPNQLDFSKLTNIQYNKKANWEQEGFDKARITGRINMAEKYIEVMEDDKMVGKVLVDSIADYAEFQINRLGEDKTYTFYIRRKETVPWSERKKTKELFHAIIEYASPPQEPVK